MHIHRFSVSSRVFYKVLRVRCHPLSIMTEILQYLLLPKKGEIGRDRRSDQWPLLHQILVSRTSGVSEAGFFSGVGFCRRMAMIHNETLVIITVRPPLASSLIHPLYAICCIPCATNVAESGFFKVGDVPSGDLLGQLVNIGFLEEGGARCKVAIFFLVISSSSSRMASSNSLLPEGGVSCREARPVSMGGSSIDNDGYREGPRFSSHLRCSAKLFFVIGASSAHVIFVVAINLSSRRDSRRVTHVSGQG